MTTNKIYFSSDKSFLIPFLNTIFRKENKGDKLICEKFFHLLELLVTKTPKIFKESLHCDENEIRIELPNWKYLNTMYNNYLTEAHQTILINWLHQKFFLVFETYMQSQKNLEYQEAIYKFIEIYGLSENSFDMLKKRDYRYRKMLKTKNKTSHFNVSLSFMKKSMLWTF